VAAREHADATGSIQLGRRGVKKNPIGRSNPREKASRSSAENCLIRSTLLVREP
jgi:hypothetical protein